MTNIGEDRKVVLAPLREVPYETTFLLSDAKQDQSIPNRYWFDFPSQWTHQANKDPIIGIRDMYITKTNRFIKFSYKIELISFDAQEPTGETVDCIEGTITCWLDGSDTIRKITDTFNQWWNKDGERTGSLTDEQHKWSDWEIQAYYEYDENTQKTYLCFGRGIGETSYYSLENGNETTALPYQVSITLQSEDAQVLFNTQSTLIAHWNNNAPCVIKIPIWSRYQCLIKSSIANNDKNNIIGHTRNDAYNPIKYYRLNHDLNKFWIELYETRNHDCPVEFPSDKRDDLIIEAIVCLSSQAML